MALHVTDILRTFLHHKNEQEISLDDPNTNYSPEEVLTFYSNLYPELTNATIHGPKMEGDKLIYEFKSTIGTKG